MDEQEIRRMVKSRPVIVDAVASWQTPAGNPRKSPIYEGEVTNSYLGKRKTIKAKSVEEFEERVRMSASNPSLVEDS